MSCRRTRLVESDSAMYYEFIIHDVRAVAVPDEGPLPVGDFADVAALAVLPLATEVPSPPPPLAPSPAEDPVVAAATLLPPQRCCCDDGIFCW